MEEVGTLEKFDEDIQEATSQCNRERVFQLHGERYDWLRNQYLVAKGNTAVNCLKKVKCVVLTVDLAIKILARLSQRHKEFLQRCVTLGIVDEIHNVSQNQLFSLAVHMSCLICAGDQFQDLRDDKMISGGSCVDWLLANSEIHELLEVWRYGPDILKLFREETDRKPFTDIVKRSFFRSGLKTSVKFFLVQDLQWD